MKLLLTSNGLSNVSIANSLESLVGKPRQKTKIAFVPTAAFPQDDAAHESRDWLVDDLYRIKQFCGFIDIVSLADLTPAQILERLEYADVLFFGGGNTFYLSYWMEKTGLFKELPRLLKDRVYAGISAGSLIASASLRVTSQALAKFNLLKDTEYDELGPREQSLSKAAKLVPFVVRPHFNSPEFPKIRSDFLKKVAATLDVPMYAIDDESAVLVDGEHVEVISEGMWKLFNDR